MTERKWQVLHFSWLQLSEKAVSFVRWGDYESADNANANRLLSELSDCTLQQVVTAVLEDGWEPFAAVSGLEPARGLQGPEQCIHYHFKRQTPS